MRREFSLAVESHPLEWAEGRQSTPMASVPPLPCQKEYRIRPGVGKCKLRREAELSQTQLCGVTIVSGPALFRRC